jgi:hypothetical protein
VGGDLDNRDRGLLPIVLGRREASWPDTRFPIPTQIRSVEPLEDKRRMEDSLVLHMAVRLLVSAASVKNTHIMYEHPRSHPLLYQKIGRTKADQQRLN